MIKTSSGTVYYTQQEVNNKVNEVMEDGYKITNAIYEEACERDWCEQYDEWAENVNATLKFFEIPLSRKEYAVTYSITRTQTARVTVTVTATSEDAAEDQASDMYDEGDLADRADESDWETQDIDIDSTEIEET
jgi:hypothetical protein